MNLKILNLPVFHLLASHPAVRHSCTRCATPEFLHNKGNYVRFTKSIYPHAMVCPFILY